ncbi:hypothetical protein [Pedobacter hiemivivus]|uniref:DUF4249 family protein n=1 Tax=Pedobacter hiemivivus TaxID=2530454 RepID=A0A4V2MGH6_9SPHI|nr:hypothetical protein [Pedobacter hiemivivus]TCC82606.1 hypothetical protein EZ444_26550 [Pedobacter hiemivivus]
MKTQLIPFRLISLCLLFLLSCSKKEILNENTSHIVRLTLQGNSSDSLEYIIDNKVLATVGGGFNTQTIVGFSDEQKELQIRNKNSGAIVQTKAIAVAPFDQTIILYYDGTQAYDKVINLLIKGYAVSGELEFLVGGKIIHTGNARIEKENVQVLMKENSSREIEIRKKGETTILFSKTIPSMPDRQTLNFFFDGTSIVDNVVLRPPANPLNMLISAKFQSLYGTLGYYLGADIDLIFYERNTVTGITTKITPEIRFTLPANGNFNEIELPPLPHNSDVVYGCDIVEKGTNNLPYTATATVPPFISAALPYQPNVGRFGNPIVFEAGKSKLMVIGDGKFTKTSIPRSTSLGITVTDLSQYFK